MSSKIHITGASGFIGSELYEYLKGKNYNVITDDGTREYLGQKYFVFYLEATT